MWDKQTPGSAGRFLFWLLDGHAGRAGFCDFSQRSLAGRRRCEIKAEAAAPAPMPGGHSTLHLPAAGRSDSNRSQSANANPAIQQRTRYGVRPFARPRQRIPQ